VTNRIEWCPPFYFLFQPELDVVTDLSEREREVGKMWLVKTRTTVKA
jgi:hypothetical protein